MENLNRLHSLLWGDFDQNSNFPSFRPLLAHYTSIATLESIIANNELWFSNPLNMNDSSELKFGMVSALVAFRASTNILRTACKSQSCCDALIQEFESLFHEFDSNHVRDTYIFCLSEHDLDGVNHNDGRLSMWRTYGANGNGTAVVFDLSKIDFIPGSHPIMISAVQYLSTQDRDDWIKSKIATFAEFVASANLTIDEIKKATAALFHRFKMFSIFTKHCGFYEEREWRVAYLENMDYTDAYRHMLGYSNTDRGVQLKFKYKIGPIAGITADDLSLEKIVSQIILGPTNYNFLSIESVKRMLTIMGRPELANKLSCSSIPFRPV